MKRATPPSQPPVNATRSLARWTKPLVFACVVALAFALSARATFADEAGLATARQHEDEGRYKEAAEAYRAVLSSSKCPYDIHVRYQGAALKAGSSEDLIAWYDALVEKEGSLEAKLHRIRLDAPANREKPLEALAKEYKDSFDVDLEMARMYLDLGDGKKAEATLKKVLAVAPASRTDVPLLMAWALYAQGDADDAAKSLDAYLTAHPEDQEAWVMLALYQLELERFEDSIRSANKALLIRPTYIAAMLARAEAERSMGKRDAAIATLTGAQRVNGADLGVLVALADAIAAEETEEAYGRAAAFYDQVLSADEENIAALHGLGWVREREQKYEQALDLYERLAAVLPDDPMSHNSVGVALFKMGQVSQAQSKFKLASDKDKDFIAAQANLGMTYDAQARYALAIKIYEKILKDKDHKDNLPVIIACAFDHESLGAYSKATKLLERAHELKPDDSDICVWLGDNYYFQKKWKTAVKWYTNAVERKEDSFFAWRGLGYALLQMRKFEDAVKALEKARALSDKDPNVSLVLGDIYLDEIEDDEKALELYKEYIARGGDDPAVEELIAELESRLK